MAHSQTKKIKSLMRDVKLTLSTGAFEKLDVLSHRLNAAVQQLDEAHLDQSEIEAIHKLSHRNALMIKAAQLGIAEGRAKVEAVRRGRNLRTYGSDGVASTVIAPRAERVERKL